MRRLLPAFLIFALVLGLCTAAALWIVTTPSTVAASSLTPHAANLDNGRTMFSLVAAPLAMLRTRKQNKAGRRVALKSPFGTFYSPNISSDPADGIGKWSEADFITAMWKGTSPAGQHYYPSFPYTSYQRMSEADVRDLFSYLKTLPAVKGKARGHDLPFPFNVRRGLGLWKLLFLDGHRFAGDSAKSQQWNCGAYLVNGPGHCAECHSPRNRLGAIIANKRFAGGPDPEGSDGQIPNITPSRNRRLFRAGHCASS